MDDAAAHRRIRRARLRGHGLAARHHFGSPVEVVRALGALQAQDYHQSLWSIGARLSKPALEVVLASIEAGEIVRAWSQRGTIHWIPAADANWIVGLSAARTVGAAAAAHEAGGITAPVVDRAQNLLVDALHRHPRLTRGAIMQLWRAAGVPVDGQNGYRLLWHLGHRRVIVIGPMAGRQQTFTLLNSGVGGDRPDGLVEFARRYLTSHGPAGAEDFAWWAGITVTQARAAVHATGLPSEPVGRRELWGGAGENHLTATGVQFIAGFDEFVIGYRNRDAVVAPADFERIVPGRNGMFFPCVVNDGEVVGTWKRTVGKRLDVAVSMFRPDAAARSAVEAAANTYAAFLGMDLGMFDVGW
jgi:hypothetical protein